MKFRGRGGVGLVGSGGSLCGEEAKVEANLDEAVVASEALRIRRRENSDFLFFILVFVLCLWLPCLAPFCYFWTRRLQVSIPGNDRLKSGSVRNTTLFVGVLRKVTTKNFCSGRRIFLFFFGFEVALRRSIPFWGLKAWDGVW